MTGNLEAMTQLEPNPLRRVLLASLIPLLLSILAVSAAEPTIWSPYPGVQFLLLASGWPQWLTACVAPLIFVVSIWNVAFGRSQGQLLHIAVAMGVLTVSSGAYFWLRLPQGLDHQGLMYSAAMVIVNAAGLLAFWVAWAMWRRRLTAARSICLSLLACCWLFWCGFPYFGEGI
jgi:hypothetical protein